MTAQALPPPTELKTAIELRPGEEVIVTCQCEIKLELLGSFSSDCVKCSAKPERTPQFLIDATQPTTVTAIACTLLTPNATLGPHFAHDWRRLPGSVKARILASNLTFEGPITGDGEEEDDEDFTYASHLRHYCALRPDFAQAAKQAFYQSNVIALRGWWSLPPRDVRQHITRVTATVCAAFGTDWDALTMLSKGENGLGSLRYVEVIIDAFKTDKI